MHTGSPVRRALLNGDAHAGRQRLGFDQTRPVLLVTGGSLGAQKLNLAVAQALATLLEGWQIVHICGARRDLPEAQPGYVPLAYVDEGWGDILAAADLVVSRAGANAVFELLALRKLHLLVPLPAAASRGDQIENAAYAKGQGYSEVVRDEALDGETLAAAVGALWAEREARAAALETFPLPDAISNIVAVIEGQSAAHS